MTYDFGREIIAVPIDNQSVPCTVSFEELLETKGYIVYRIVGCSMLPLLRQKRDIVEIRPKGAERCRKNDVVLYKRNNKYILHRILKVCPNGYIIAGDNNILLEKDISDNQILGIMKSIVRNGKEINMDGIIYKAYVFIWCDLYPVRIFILRIKAKMVRIIKMIYKTR